MYSVHSQEKRSLLAIFVTFTRKKIPHPLNALVSLNHLDSLSQALLLSILFVIKSGSKILSFNRYEYFCTACTTGV